MSKDIIINQDITEDGLFSGDWANVDTDASAEKYTDMVLAQVSERFPDASVTVNSVMEATLDIIVLDGYVYPEYDEVYGVVEDVMNRIYSDFGSWVVANA